MKNYTKNNTNEPERSSRRGAEAQRMQRKMKQSEIPWIREVPEEWDFRNASVAFYENKNYNTKLENLNALQFRFGQLVPKPEMHIDNDLKDTFSKYTLIKPNDISINGLNLNFDFVTQRVAISNTSGILTSSYIIMSPRDNIVPNYFSYLIKTMDNLKLLNGMGSGLRLTLTFNMFKNELILFPPLSDQSAIANFLDEKCAKIDALIENEEKIIAELNEYKNQLAVYYTTKGLKKTKLKQTNIDWIGETPEHWQVLPLYAIFKEHKSKNTGMQENNLLSLSYGNIIRKDINTDEGLLPENFEGYNIVDKGDIVLRLTDMQNDQRSLRTGLVRERGIITSAYVTIRNFENANSEYLRYLLHSADICKIIYNFGFGIRQNLKFSELKRMDLILPPKNEQDDIVSFLNKKFLEVDNLIVTKKQKIIELKDYKKSLIYEYVTGKKEIIL